MWKKRIADAVQRERSVREPSIKTRIDVTEYFDESGGYGQDITFEGDFGHDATVDMPDEKDG